YRSAAVLGSIRELAREALLHRVLAARAGGGDDPAERQCLAAVGAHLDGHLVGGAADAARADLDGRLHVREGIVEDLHRLLAAALPDALERAVDDRLGNRLLALVHEHVHELRQHDIPEFRIGENLALFGGPAAGHPFSPYFGRLAPYFDRRWRRSLTPWVSRTPRMMW